MAQKRKRKNKRKWIFWGFILVLVIVAGVICYLVWDNYFKEGDMGEETGSSEIDEKEETNNNDNKEDTKPKDDEGEIQIVEKEKIVQYEGDNPNKADDLSGAITYAGVNNGNLMIRINIDQYLEGGECKLSLLRNNSAIYNGTAKIINSASTSTCEGFDVPVSVIGGGDLVKIVIDLDSNGRSGSIVGEVNV